jgi:hypothetical protein
MARIIRIQCTSVRQFRNKKTTTYQVNVLRCSCDVIYNFNGDDDDDAYEYSVNGTSALILDLNTVSL